MLRLATIAKLMARNFPLSTSHQLATLIVPYVLLVLVTAAVMLRFRSRHLKKVKPGVDDWLCLVALVRDSLQIIQDAKN